MDAAVGIYPHITQINTDRTNRSALRFDEQAGQLQKVWDVVDGLAQRVYERYPWLPCRIGCDGCCQSTLWGISDAEGRALARAVAGLDEETRERARARAQAQLAELYERRDGRGAEWRVLLAGEGKRYAPCPLLEDDKCLVYAARPLACRVHGVSQRASLGKRYWCEMCAVAALRQHGEVELIDLDWLYRGMAWEFRRGRKPIAAWVVNGCAVARNG